MTERPRKSVPQPKAPEKDEHGCLIGVEVYDAEKGKCVSIIRRATVGIAPKSFHEQMALKSYKE